MAQRFAGVAELEVDGEVLSLRGNFTVSASPLERTMIAGQDTVHGYQELPRVPYIEGDISTVQQLWLETIDAQVDIVVIAKLANQKMYILNEAVCKSALENNTRDGQVRVRWEGTSCEETTWGV